MFLVYYWFVFLFDEEREFLADKISKVGNVYNFYNSRGMRVPEGRTMNGGVIIVRERPYEFQEAMQ